MIPILTYGQVKNDEIFARVEPKIDVTGIVSDIIETVRREGDAALLAYCKKFDGADMNSLLVTPEEMEEALSAVDPKFIGILTRAAANIRKFHEKQVRNSFIVNDECGIVMGQKVIPVDRAGLYVPGGTAAYPSTSRTPAILAGMASMSTVEG